MPRHPVLLSTLVAAFVVAVPAHAQQAQNRPVQAPPPLKSGALLRQLVPSPTGENGYEELLAAAEAFAQSRLFEGAQQPGTSLAFKREVLADVNVVKALRLLRQGVSKPVLSPRSKLTFSTLLPELTYFRALGRLLALQQYVYLADGRTREAIGNARLAMRFAQVIQTDTMISGLVGIAVGSLCIRPLAEHLDQLSAQDCAALYEVCLEWLAQPNPEIKIVDAERRAIHTVMEEFAEFAKKDGVAGAAQRLGFGEGAAGLLGVPATPEALDGLSKQVCTRLDEFYSGYLQELQRPPWQRKAPQYRGNGDPADTLVGLIVPALGKVDDAYTSEAARIRLLACHCVILRYRWERNEVPPSLDALNLGELALDPFTGQPLRYQPLGRKYSLSSVGAPASDPNDPRAVDGRVPISLNE